MSDDFDRMIRMTTGREPPLETDGDLRACLADAEAKLAEVAAERDAAMALGEADEGRCQRCGGNIYDGKRHNLAACLASKHEQYVQVSRLLDERAREAQGFYTERDAARTEVARLRRLLARIITTLEPHLEEMTSECLMNALAKDAFPGASWADIERIANEPAPQAVVEATLPHAPKGGGT